MTSFEAVDEHVKSLAPLPNTAATGVAVGTFDVCAYYARIRPILAFLAGMPFLPATWRAELTSFVAAGDMICPPG